MISETRTTAPCCRREPVSQFVCDACGYSHPVGEITGVDVMTAGGKKHLSLCGHHAAKLLKQLAQEAGEHPALMEILKEGGP